VIRFGEDAWRFDRPAGSDAARLSARLLELAADVVVAERHVLVVEPADLAAITAALREDLGAPAPPAREHLVPVVYDGEDLADFGLPPAEVARHAAAGYRVALLGFLPGFAYLGGTPEELCRPRRASPRARVPAGALAIGGPYSGVYPRVSPGGWNLVGRAPGFRAFDAERGPTLALGDAVRFVEGGAGEPPPAARPAPAVAQGLRFLAGLATVQDGGRPGRLHQGLPAGGALVPPLLAAANLAVGNPPLAAGLEIFGGARVAAAGRALGVSVDGEPARHLGEELQILPGARRVRYLAVAGGLAVPAALLVAGLGGPLAPGRVLPVGAPASPLPAPPPLDEEPVRVRPGPDLEAFPPGAFEAFVRHPHRLGTLGDRSGVRLVAPDDPAWRPLHAAAGSSAPMRAGAVQITPSGEPIVLGSEHPVTGGYRVLCVVHIADIAKLFAKRPGDSVSLRV
jgi:allophanate hydrolase subunit 1/allophanate hydrolase subunit 2